MPFFGDGLSAHDAGCAAIGPCDGERDDDEQGRELVGIGDVGVFDVEATGLCIREHAFDPPSPAVEVEAAPAVTEAGGDDEQLASLDALGGDAQSVVG